ncbi:MAG: protein kinase [Synechococcus sp.]
MNTRVKVARVVFASEDFFKEESSRVFVELWELGRHSHRTSNARLVPDPQILDRYELWRKAYKRFYQHLNFRDGCNPADVLGQLQGKELIELQACKKNLTVCSDDLVSAFNHWLSSQPSFRDGIENWLSDRFNLEDREIRIAIESDDPNVRRLPWHAWSLLSRFDQAELSIGDTRHDNYGNALLPTGGSRHLKLLAVLGYEGGLDLDRDRQTIQALPNVEAEFLYQPSLQELRAALTNSHWDSFYFGGHSASNPDGSTGVLYLNSQGPIEISQLKSALKIAVRDGGLQLGMFNSCDGLGLAAELEDVHFPLSIVMREPVPNVVAQRFLTYFLQAFTSGKPLYLALRQARLLLEDNSEELPYVSWLPAIAHDSSTTPLLWQDNSWEQNDATALGVSQPFLEPATTVVLSEREASSIPVVPQPSTILGGSYEVLGSLSSGGFSVTYVAKALDLPGQPKCAIKQLKPMNPKVDLAKAREWFELEAQILFELGSSTDRIPTFYARFEEGGEFYLVQEFIDGEELEKELRYRGRLSEFETLELLQTILEGLEIVHRKSIIHRDIKPSNLMRRKSDGKIVLIDFGAVKEVIAMATQTGADFRRQGTIVGSPGFMAPEQSSGYPLQASDIFSVGAIALRAVTGIAPVQVFSAEGKTGRLIRQDSVQVSEEMANLLNSMTHIDPECRFAHAGEALQAVRQFMQFRERGFVTDPLQYDPSSAVPTTHRNLTTGGGLRTEKGGGAEEFRPDSATAQSAQQPSGGNFFNRLFGGRKPSSPSVQPQAVSDSFQTGSDARFTNSDAISSTPSFSSAPNQGGESTIDETRYINADSTQRAETGSRFQPGTEFTDSGSTSQPFMSTGPSSQSPTSDLRPINTVGSESADVEKSPPTPQFQPTSSNTGSRPTMAGSSTGSVGVMLSPQQIEQLSQTLSESLGPMAGVTIRNALKSAQSQQEFIETLLGWLPPNEQSSFRKFANGVCSQAQGDRASQADRNASTTTYFSRPQTVAWTSAAPTNTSGAWVHDTDFLEQCQIEMAKQIGPIAAFTIQQALNKHSASGDRDAFIQELASHLSDPDSANSFKALFQQ